MRRLFALIAEHQVALDDLAERAGVGLTAISRWQANRTPIVHNLQAVFNSLGYQLYVKPIGAGRPVSQQDAVDRQVNHHTGEKFDRH